MFCFLYRSNLDLDSKTGFIFSLGRVFVTDGEALFYCINCPDELTNMTKRMKPQEPLTTTSTSFCYCVQRNRSNNNKANVRLMWLMLPVHTVQVDKGQKYVAAAFQRGLLGADWGKNAFGQFSQECP